MGCSSSSEVTPEVEKIQTEDNSQEVIDKMPKLTEPEEHSLYFEETMSTPTSMEGSLTPEVVSLSESRSTLSDAGQSIQGQEYNFDDIDKHARQVITSKTFQDSIV